MLSAEDTIAKKVELIYSQANAELLQFMEAAERSSLVLTASEQAYYSALQTEARRLSIVAQQEAGKLIDGAITSAFVEGALTHADDLAFNLIHDQAVRELSSYSLDLIQQTTDSMRRAVQQQIGVALVEGLTAAELRERIVKTGLSNISRWRSIEQRAGVIARTETMRAYNHGALAGIRATGASYVRWVASPDEATCSICQPRAGKVYLLTGYAPVKDSGYTSAPYLPPGDPPAHPRCRCTVRAVYRRPDGSLIGSVAPKTPSVPEGGLTASTPIPAHPPSVAASFDDELAALKNPLHQADAATLARQEAYWRGLILDDDQMRALARASEDIRVFGNYTSLRFSVTTQIDAAELAAWQASSELRFQVIRALERFNAIKPGLVGGRYFNTLMLGNGGFGRMGAGTLADCFSSGIIRMPPRRVLPYFNNRLRVSADGVDEILTHELSHALHNTWRYSSADELAAWRRVRRGAGPFVEDSGVLSSKTSFELAQAQGQRDAWAKLVAEWDSTPEVAFRFGPGAQRLVSISDGRYTFTAGQTSLESARLMLQGAEKRLATVTRKIATPDHYPTAYAQQNEWEDYAESAMMFLLDPARLASASPKRYSYFLKVLRTE